MPATYTHHTFTKDVYKVINTNIKEKVDEDLFCLFGKSFDILFFSKPKLGSYAHNHNVNKYFSNIIKTIRDNNLQHDAQVLAYLYGSICHYVLDSTAHPYIYYKTGKYQDKDKKTKKYRGMHDKFEYMIDAIFYEDRKNMPIYKANIRKEVFVPYNFNSNLNEVIDKAYLDTFNVSNANKLIKRGIKNYSFMVRYAMMSRLGIKYRIYKLCDILHISKKCYYQNYCYYIKKLDYSVLNKEHKKWYYPVDKRVSYHYSFYDLYDVAIEKARTLINDIDDAIDKDDKTINKVLREIGNLSYSTGKNSDKDYVMKYFEY